ncbi:MAG TPA: MmcQ/YjbR family DNA-binding protein [Isosphaeraceae bacterium]|jgi:predicted DNA-binding protein (MmcQ/YjbR family)|nr:MmcQ/YjbR family DNA-binding protein [Isosphaeraceae bacterium]
MTDQNWNPYFRAPWNHCSAKPDAVEDHPWGETVFKIGGKVFAFLGSPDHGGAGMKVAPDQIDGLLALPFVRRSPYIGRYGWLAITIADDDALALAQELIDTSYEMIASKSKGRERPSHGRKGAKKKRTRRKTS